MMTGVTQSEFRQAVFDPTIQRPDGLTNGQGSAAGKRFDVYRNNVIVSLKEAMTTSFPAILNLIGEQNFNAITGVFVRAHPPQDPRLVLYGEAFPEFLAGFEPLAHLPYLADVARLELALRASYHAEDAQPVHPAIFGTLPPEDLATRTVSFAPALRILRSGWPVAEIYTYATQTGAPQPSGHAQDVLVTRREFDPEFHILPPGGAALLAALMSDSPLGTALDTLHETHPNFDFPAFLGFLLSHGAITDVATADPSLSHNE